MPAALGKLSQRLDQVDNTSGAQLIGFLASGTQIRSLRTEHQLKVLAPFAPIPDEPGLYVDSGQWTPEQAARLTEACDGLPVKVWRGVALAYSEPGVVVVDKGGNAGRAGDLRLTMAKATEEFKATATPLEKKR